MDLVTCIYIYIMVIVDFLNGKLQGKYTSTIYPIVKAKTVRFFVAFLGCQDV